MSTTAPTKRRLVPNSVPSRQGLADWAGPYLRSSIGGKYLVAVTGLILTGFVIIHMLGNLQVFLGPDAINTYAVSLKKNEGLLWTIRIFLLVTFLVHIGMALWLNWRAKRARPIGYAHERTVQASFASRHMVITGLVILAFTAYHIAHFTLGVTNTAEIAPGEYRSYHELTDAANRPDVYSMMLYGFRSPLVVTLYILAQIFLFLHLTHGVASMFQTVGLNSPRAQRLIRRLAWAVAILVCGGNIGIVFGVHVMDHLEIIKPSVQVTANPGGGPPPLPMPPPVGAPKKSK